ncbi:hypothetical protein H0H87_005590 [Tephrocybe sp. NHM501043]|nr:hypothetical protein H0H87_005590 [Tephrocybe sp. NHM501043]
MRSSHCLISNVQTASDGRSYHNLGSFTDTLAARNYVSERTVRDSYDFIVAGGGLAGLTIASRLTERLNVTVLVLEAGQTGDAVLGGSSAINGMYYVRPSKVEIDAWNALLDSDNTSPSWGWDTLHSSMMKSEVFTPPKSDVQSMAKIRFNPASYGSTGNVHVSYPGFMYNVIGDWTPSLESIGIPSATDPAGGQNTGGFVSALSINPANWTRSYSKSAFIDALPPRRNLDILVSATVTRIIFGDANSKGGKIATGVEFAASELGARTVVKVNKEVIVTGGALGSPKILMHSGVGPKDTLDAAGIPLVSELPGVGQHLQDHLAVPVNFKSKVETAGDIEASGSDFSTNKPVTNSQKQPLTMSFVNSAIAYINATTLFGNDVATFSSGIANARDSSASSLVPSQYPEVIEGYNSLYLATQSFLEQDVGQVEMLLSINAQGIITIQAALQHPYSQGRVYINSSSPFDPIVIDPQYFSHPADIIILRQGVKLARKLSQAAPISAAIGVETSPGADISTDEQIESWIRNMASTEFHPQATCSMLPKGLGGVVNSELQVYGLGIGNPMYELLMPRSSLFHLQLMYLSAPTYGLAEKVSDILEALYSTPTNTMTPIPDPGNPAPSQVNTEKNAASRLSRELVAMIVILVCGVLVSWM